MKCLVYFVFFYDEEVGCWGVLYFIVWLLEFCVFLFGVFIGELSNMCVVFVYKGKVVVWIIVCGWVGYFLWLDFGLNVIYVMVKVFNVVVEEVVCFMEGLFDVVFEFVYFMF